jgi:hypothetical protein
MNFKDWSGVLGTWVSISAALLGGYLALQSYQADIKVREKEADKIADARVVQTFDLAKQFSSGDLLRVRSKLIGSAFSQDPSVSNARIRQLGEQMDQDLWAFVDFFDTVQVCVDRDLCDAELAWRLFNPYAGSWYGALLPAIEPVRKYEQTQGADYRAGYGLEALSQPKAVYLGKHAPERP